MTNLALTIFYAGLDKDHFFTADNQRHCLMAHMYHHSGNMRKLRCLDNLHLVEFCLQPLKSKENFESAMEKLEHTALRKYMEKYAVFFPGDWPAQFYVRQVAYSHCNFDVAQGAQTQGLERYANFPKEHKYFKEANHPFNTTDKERATNSDMYQKAVPLIGSLHIALNSKEDVMVNFHAFFNYFYEYVFPGCKLAAKPEP